MERIRKQVVSEVEQMRREAVAEAERVCAAKVNKKLYVFAKVPIIMLNQYSPALTPI